MCRKMLPMMETDGSENPESHDNSYVQVLLSQLNIVNITVPLI